LFIFCIEVKAATVYYGIPYSELPKELQNTDLSKKNVKIIFGNDTRLYNFICDYLKVVGYEANLNFIDVSKISDLSGLFAKGLKCTNIYKFNGDISQWDVSNVTNMLGLFLYSEFNGDISKWDVSNVTNMRSMFEGAKFSGDISQWNVSKVRNMQQLFASNESFRSDISNWDVSSVVNMIAMFGGAKIQVNINKWRPKELKKTNLMFFYSEVFSDLSGWDFSHLKSATGMLGESKFNNYNFDFNQIPYDLRNKIFLNNFNDDEYEALLKY
ncbi:BspA family leucine-rich repeat surface protein, partial [Psittacicella hinzii]